MKLRSLFLGAAVVIAGVALAHHVPVPLSYIAGEEILTEVVVRLGADQPGVPAYKLARGEHEHHIALAHGDSFWVIDGLNPAQRVEFRAEQFADIDHADEHEVVDAINAQVSVAQAFSQNSYFGFRGMLGGTNHKLRLEDGVGSPLSKLDFDMDQVLGRNTVDLVLSIPADHHGAASAHEGLEHHPYLLLASATDGASLFKGATIPLGRDGTMVKFFRNTANGALAGFRGNLDDNADAAASLPVQQLAQLLGPTPPSKVYFAYVVFSMDMAEVEFVSNRFTVNIVP